tara:strand:+ start:2348 stop:2548 length:201 start_codon:yes stop_codon:yes gene_type:complete
MQHELENFFRILLGGDGVVKKNSEFLFLYNGLFVVVKSIEFSQGVICIRLSLTFLFLKKLIIYKYI